MEQHIRILQEQSAEGVTKNGFQLFKEFLPVFVQNFVGVVTCIRKNKVRLRYREQTFY
jgi:hypothetical protein